MTVGCPESGPSQTPKPHAASSDTDDGPTNDPCPVLTLSTVRLDAPTPRDGASSCSRWKGWFFHSRTCDAYARPARHFRPSFSNGTAEKGTPTDIRAAALCVASLGLRVVCLPASDRSLKRHGQPITSRCRLYKLQETPSGQMFQPNKNRRSHPTVQVSGNWNDSQSVDQLSQVDHVPSNAHSSQGESQLYIFEDKEAVIKMIIKGRSPTMRTRVQNPQSCS